MPTKLFARETDLAAPICKYLEQMGFEVYQEVIYAGTADIVAKRRGLLWVIECKLRYNFEVLQQASNWRPYAHWVSVAVPSPKYWSITPVVSEIHKKLGLGLIYVGPNNFGDGAIIAREMREPPLHRKVNGALAKALREEQKTYAATGSAGVKRWTPFKSTVRDVVRYVQFNPGVSMKEVLDNLPTHYQSKSTARSRLVYFIETGVINEIRLERHGKELRLYPTEKAIAAST